MKYSVSALVLGFFAALSAAVPTPDLDGLDPSQVSLGGITYGGTGCPAGSASISHSPDYQTFTLVFADFRATLGSGSIADQVKNCALNLQIHYPPGYQYTLYKIQYSGYALLEPGVTAKQQTSYWFAGFVGDKPTFNWSLNGPYYNSYTLTDTLAGGSSVWSPCGASTTLDINTQIVVTSNNPNAQGLVDIKYQHSYGVNWRKCH